MSKPKLFQGNAGYVARKKNPITGSYNVIYVAALQGIEASDKYIAVCEAHGTIVSAPSLHLARQSAKDSGLWCAQCREYENPVEFLKA